MRRFLALRNGGATEASADNVRDFLVDRYKELPRPVGVEKEAFVLLACKTNMPVEQLISLYNLKVPEEHEIVAIYEIKSQIFEKREVQESEDISIGKSN